jgi:hypothetical protein
MSVLFRGSLRAILLANLVSLEILWVGGVAAFALWGGIALYAEVLLAGALIQFIWLTRHVWQFHRDHLRVTEDRGHSRVRPL